MRAREGGEEEEGRREGGVGGSGNFPPPVSKPEVFVQDEKKVRHRSVLGDHTLLKSRQPEPEAPLRPAACGPVPRCPSHESTPQAGRRSPSSHDGSVCGVTVEVCRPGVPAVSDTWRYM